MAEKTLGAEFWIHGGGLDLVFPHHENERAQSQAVGRPFAKIWMHNGLLRFTGEKMSKSVGNVATIQEVIAEWGPEAALLFLMTGHWRKPLEFSEDAMTAATVQVESLRNALRGETRSTGDWEELATLLDEDFNTPAALALFHRWAREGALDELRRGLAIFGLEGLAEAVDAPVAVVELARARAQARGARDFATSDRLRDEIAASGWEVRDVQEAAGGFELVPLR
jgi:cysteinyl-tRNA synthetase